VAALASWLDARAHGGHWLVRIEDVDSPRCVPGAARLILEQLAACGLHSDAPVWVQSERSEAYRQALHRLQQQGATYACACTRRDIEQVWLAQGRSRARHAEWPYPGTCRNGTGGRAGRAWRLHTGLATQKFIQKQASAQITQGKFASFIEANICHWTDRKLGRQHQDVEQQVGDFVLRRADGLWAYQLAVVVDDAAQGITHVVRGEDLADNTPRQLLLQAALDLPHPTYLHAPLVCGPDGEKLSKQNGAQALDLSSPLQALHTAAQVLGLPQAPDGAVPQALAFWVAAWARRWLEPAA
jgi:glutamyl-Q tRNA(Asp) synthetase